MTEEKASTAADLFSTIRCYRDAIDRLKVFLDAILADNKFPNASYVVSITSLSSINVKNQYFPRKGIIKLAKKEIKRFGKWLAEAEKELGKL